MARKYSTLLECRDALGTPTLISMTDEGLFVETMFVHRNTLSKGDNSTVRIQASSNRGDRSYACLVPKDLKSKSQKSITGMSP